MEELTLNIAELHRVAKRILARDAELTGSPDVIDLLGPHNVGFDYWPLFAKIRNVDSLSYNDIIEACKTILNWKE